MTSKKNLRKPYSMTHFEDKNILSKREQNELVGGTIWSPTLDIYAGIFVNEVARKVDDLFDWITE